MSVSLYNASFSSVASAFRHIVRGHSIDIPAGARRLSQGAADPALTPVQFGRRRSSALFVHGGSGSQGAVIARAALPGQDQSHDREVFVVARDPVKAEAHTQVVDGDGQVHHLASKGVKFVRDERDSGYDAEKSSSVFTVPSSALPSAVRQSRSARKLATYNGTPPNMSGEPAHGVSMYTSGPDGKGSFQFGKGGYLQVAQDSPAGLDLQKVLDPSIIDVRPVADVTLAQWNKIGLNTALNSLCTIFRCRIGELHQQMSKDPRMSALVLGILSEVAIAARRQAGVQIDPKTIFSMIKGLAQTAGKHPTSMQDSFCKGQSTEEDVLSGGIATIAGHAAPLCGAVTMALKTMIELRGKAPVGAHFDEDNAGTLQGLREGLLRLTEPAPAELVLS